MLYLGSLSNCSDLFRRSSVISLLFLYRLNIRFCLSSSSVSFRSPIHPAPGVRNSVLPGPYSSLLGLPVGLKASGPLREAHGTSYLTPQISFLGPEEGKKGMLARSGFHWMLFPREVV